MGGGGLRQRRGGAPHRRSLRLLPRRCARLSVSLSVSLSLCLSVCLSVSLPLCLSACLSFRLLPRRAPASLHHVLRPLVRPLQEPQARLRRGVLGGAARVHLCRGGLHCAHGHLQCGTASAQRLWNLSMWNLHVNTYVHTAHHAFPANPQKKNWAHLEIVGNHNRDSEISSEEITECCKRSYALHGAGGHGWLPYPALLRAAGGGLGRSSEAASGGELR